MPTGLSQLSYEGRSKIEVVIDRLRAFEPAEGYYLAFSGGKDSVVLYRLAEIAGVRFDAHYHITTVDPPELVRFIRESYPTVQRDRPPLSMRELVIKHQFPPIRQQRYCCQELKENGGEGRIVLTGIRWAESSRRKRRRLTEACLRGRQRIFVNLIIDWSNKDVWAFIKQENVPYCSLYNEGFERLGCMLCPQSSNEDALRHIARWPWIVKQWQQILDEVIAIRRANGKRISFGTGQEMFEWWISRQKSPRHDQPVLFE